MLNPIKVTYQSTSNVYIANQWLHSLPDTIACDFEVAIKYTDEQLASFSKQLENQTLSKLERKHYESLLSATALDHPSHCTLTHLQIAWSDHEAYVFILDNKKITDLILTFLTTTTKRQIWHNATFDFKHIMYYTNKIPIEFEDTAILAKTIVNHVDTWKAKVGLKELAGKWYGSWTISPDHFDVKHMYDDDVLLYAATDSCATYKLWTSINQYLKDQHEN